MEQKFIHVGLMFLMLINPFLFLSAEESQETDSVIFYLATIFRLADEENRQIRVSEAALRAASEGVRQARNALAPHLQVNISGSYMGDVVLMGRDFSTSGQTEVQYAG